MFDLPKRCQIQYNKVENFLCQILKFNTQPRLVRNNDTVSRFVKIKMICLLFDDDHKIKISETVRPSIVESLNEHVFEKMLENDDCGFVNTKIE